MSKLETNFLLTVAAINNSKFILPEVGNVIDGCKMVLQNRSDISIILVRKQTNKAVQVVHMLDRWSCDINYFSVSRLLHIILYVWYNLVHPTFWFDWYSYPFNYDRQIFLIKWWRPVNPNNRRIHYPSSQIRIPSITNFCIIIYTLSKFPGSNSAKNKILYYYIHYSSSQVWIPPTRKIYIIIYIYKDINKLPPIISIYIIIYKHINKFTGSNHINNKYLIYCF